MFVPCFVMYSKTCLKRTLSKRPKIGFQLQLSLNAGQKCRRMLQGEHSAILSTFIKLSFVIKIFVLSIFELTLKVLLLFLVSNKKLVRFSIFLLLFSVLSSFASILLRKRALVALF